MGDSRPSGPDLLTIPSLAHNSHGAPPAPPPTQAEMDTVDGMDGRLPGPRERPTEPLVHQVHHVHQPRGAPMAHGTASGVPATRSVEEICRLDTRCRAVQPRVWGKGEGPPAGVLGCSRKYTTFPRLVKWKVTLYFAAAYLLARHEKRHRESFPTSGKIHYLLLPRIYRRDKPLRRSIASPAHRR